MPQTPPVADKGKKHGCYIGRHRWTAKAGAMTLTCYYCSKSRPLGLKTLSCRLGRHRWIGVKKDGGEPYRECFFCRKYGGSPKTAIMFVSGGPS